MFHDTQIHPASEYQRESNQIFTIFRIFEERIYENIEVLDIAVLNNILAQVKVH